MLSSSETNYYYKILVNQCKCVISRHSDEVIKKLEQAGLGYHVKADETRDRLGTFIIKFTLDLMHGKCNISLLAKYDVLCPKAKV